MMLAAVLTLGVAATSCGDDDDDVIHGLYIGEGTATFWDDGELITEQATVQAQFNSDGTGFIMDNEGEIDLFNDFKVANGHLMIRWTGENETAGTLPPVISHILRFKPVPAFCSGIGFCLCRNHRSVQITGLEKAM